MSQVAQPAEVRGAGWLSFASILMVLIGLLCIVQGVILIAEDEIYVTGPDSSVVIIANVKTWGLVVLILGLLSVAAGYGVFAGAQWARFFGITMASFTILSQVGLIFGAQPWFSLVVVALCVLVIYGLAVYGGQGTSVAG